MEVKEAEALQAENAALKAKLLVMEAANNRKLAADAVAAILKEAGISCRQSLLDRVCESPVIKDGKPDTDWVKATVAVLTESAAGRVEGLGTQQTTNKEADSEKMLREALKDLGTPEAGLDIAVGRC